VYLFPIKKYDFFFTGRIKEIENDRILPVNSKVDTSCISIKLHRYLIMNRRNREDEAQFSGKYTEGSKNINKETACETSIKYF